MIEPKLAAEFEGKAGLAGAPRSKQGDVRARLELQGGFSCEGLARNTILDRVLPDEGVERHPSSVPSQRDTMYLSSEYRCVPAGNRQGCRSVAGPCRPPLRGQGGFGRGGR